MILADILSHVANGCTESSEHIHHRIPSYSYLVAVDGGCNACYTLKLTFQLITGDADVSKICFPRETDETNLELALSHLWRIGQPRGQSHGQYHPIIHPFSYIFIKPHHRKPQQSWRKNGYQLRSN